MIKKRLLILSFLAFVLSITGCNQSNDHLMANTETVSGEIIQGYRVLTIHFSPENQNLRVFRGDYVQFKFDRSIELKNFPYLPQGQDLHYHSNKSL